MHKGHLEYLLAAKKRCDLLLVGIAQCDNQDLLECPEAPHRQEAANNPLTYEERADMASRVLLEAGLKADEFAVIRFPIETPERLNEFLPASVPILTTICEEWNRHKIQVLQRYGYQVEVLWERQDKEYDGMVIRQLMCDGDERWKELVPPATTRIVEEYNVIERIQYLRKSQKKVIMEADD